jgi:hypothetical protein
MRRFFFPALMVGLLMALPALGGEDGLTGNWKLVMYDGNRQTYFWLVRLDSKDGKLTATAESLRGAPQVKVDEVKLIGDTFQIRFRASVVQMGEKHFFDLNYEGKLPKPGAKKILGSISVEDTIAPTAMEATSAKNIFEMYKEIVQRTPNDPRAAHAIIELIDAAGDKKLDAKELQELVDGSLKSADQFGPRFQMMHGLRVLSALRSEKGYADVTAETARKIAKMIDPKSSPATQLQALTSVADIVRAAKLTDDVKALDTRIDKLEGQAYAEYSKTSLNFKTEKFAGRKGKSKRAVLVELFTGAMCPPCVAADMGFDGLEKTYSDKEVVLLQYHQHIPRPEPLTNVDSDARFEYYVDAYRKQVRGTPSILFNGKPDVSGGGFRDDAPEKYKEYCEVVNKLLELPSTVTVSASAVRAGDKIDITAKVSDLDKPGDKTKLRLVLVEDWVRFKGSNGLQYHHRVVRALPGGAKGFALKQKDGEFKASVEIDELRRKNNKFLDEDYGPEGPRPMRMRDLHVVAFVQNDDTTEVLNAVDVAVREEK